MIDSRCGLHCTGCIWKNSHGCGGCIETKGNPFHGECPVAVCCQNKGIEYCGECAQIPCELLTEYSCHPEHGDKPQGVRIEQCKKWAAEINFAPCGVDCAAECPEYKKSCNGCHKIKGEVFWAGYMGKKVCPMYDCAVNENKYSHCGQCGKLPCKTHYECKDPSVTDEQHAEGIKRRIEILRNRK